MSITCQITQMTADRIRLHVPSLATEPETSQSLTQFLLALPGVTGVEIRPASGSVAILHDGTPAARDKILHALRGSQPQGDAGPRRSRPAQPAHQVGGLPYAQCTVVHAMRGRVRIHIPVLRRQAALAGVLAHFLEEQAGVRRVRLNRLAANVVVDYAPAALDFKRIVALVAAYDPEPAALERWQATAAAQPLTSLQLQHRRTLEAGLAGAALAVILFGGASAALLVYALLLVAIGSVLQRTYRSLFKDHRRTIDALSAAAMALFLLTGMVWQAALVPLVLAGARWVYPQMRARRPVVQAGAPSAAFSAVDQKEPLAPVPAKKITVGATGVVVLSAPLPADAMEIEGSVLGENDVPARQALEPDAKPDGRTPSNPLLLTGWAVWVVSRKAFRAARKAHA